MCVASPCKGMVKAFREAGNWLLTYSLLLSLSQVWNRNVLPSVPCIRRFTSCMGSRIVHDMLM